MDALSTIFAILIYIIPFIILYIVVYTAVRNGIDNSRVGQMIQENKMESRRSNNQGRK